MRGDQVVDRDQRAGPRDSMSLLQDVAENAIDDGYYAVAKRSAEERAGRSDMRWLTVGVLAVFALILTLAIVQTRSNQPVAESERAALISQINDQKAEVQSKQSGVSELRGEVSRMRSRSPDNTVRERVRTQQLTTGVGAVSGPGVRTVVDNAEDDDSGREGRVMDRDLQLLVNGLWLAGAEAIAINDNRLTTLSSIRTAGEAITVNYKSLTRPYVVDVVGDPKTIQARFLETAAGQSWSNLRDNFGLRFEMSTKDELTLPAAPRKRSKVRVAEVMEASK